MNDKHSSEDWSVEDPEDQQLSDKDLSDLEEQHSSQDLPMYPPPPQQPPRSYRDPNEQGLGQFFPAESLEQDPQVAQGESGQKKNSKKGLVLGWSAGVVAFLLLLGGAFWGVSWNSEQQKQRQIEAARERNLPEKRVAEFLNALKYGRVASAMELSGNILTESDEILINDEVYAKTKNRITDFTIKNANKPTTTASAGSKETVTAEIEREGGTSTQIFSLVTDGKDGPGGVVDKWKLEPVTFNTISVGAEGPDKADLVIAETKTKIPAGVKLSALPGDYTVQAKEPNENYTLPPTTVAVKDFSTTSQSATLVATLTDVGKAKVQGAVNDILNGCAARKERALKNCPFTAPDREGYEGYNFEPGKWSIESRPRIVTEDKWDGRGWKVTGTGGSVKFTTQASKDGEKYDYSYGPASFSLSGRVAGFAPDGSAQIRLNAP